jgi:hypothetical protein
MAPIDVTGLTPTTYDDSFKRGKLRLRDARDHSQLVEQEIINEIRREELKKARGEVVSREDLNDTTAAVTAAALEALATLPDIAAESSTPAERPAIRQRAKAWVDAVRTIMAEKLRKKDVAL